MAIQFGAFELDEQNYELRKHGNRVPVPRRVFDTIAFLAANADRVVSKQELIEGPWRGHSVTDAALARVIMRAREALDDDAANPKLITTVRGRGFRFRLTPERTGSSPERQDRLPKNVFVGRTKELENLGRAWSDAGEGRGRFLLVTGEPGIGKTALVERFSRLAGREGAVLHGKAWEAGGSPPFWIWSEALGEFCDSRDPSQLQAFAGANARDLTRIAPQLRDALLDLPGSSPSEDESLGTRFRVFESVASFLEEASSSEPLLVVLEDLHSVDDAALSLLAFLAERLSRSRVLLVATCRTPEWNRRATISALVSRSATTTFHIELAGLSEAEIAQWIELQRPRRRSSLNAAEVYCSTTGHPFLVKDFVESLAEHDAADRGQRLEPRTGGVPEHLALSVRKRLSRVPSDTLSLLERACVIGREFSISQLCSSDQDARDRNLRDLGPALREGLIEQSIHGGGRFQFHHELLRRTLYGDLPLARRLELHQSLAERLIQAVNTQESAIEIANHLLIAAPQYGVAKAILWTLAAVEYAQRKLAHELAADYCHRALELLEACGDAELRKGDVLIALGRSHHLTWQADLADATYRESAEWCATHSQYQTLGRVVLSWFEALRERIVVNEPFLRHLRTALDRITEPGSLRAQLLAVLVIADYFVKTAAEREELFQQALDMARASKDPLAVVAVINLLVISNINASDTRESLRLGGEMLAAATAAGRPDGAMDSLVLRARCLLELGEGEAFRTERIEYERLAREFRYPAQLWHCGNLGHVAAFLDGKLLEAETITRQAVETAAPSLGMLSIGLFGAQLTLLAIEKAPNDAALPLEEAQRASRELLASAPTYQPQLLLAGIQAFERGDRWTAADTLERFIAVGFEKIVRDGNYLSCLALLARLAISLDEKPAMTLLFDPLAPAAGLHAANWSHYLGPVNYYLGKLRLCLGDIEEALTRFDAAIADTRRIGSRTWRAWSEYGKAQALAASSSAQAQKTSIDLLRSVRGRATSLSMGRLLYELDLHESRAARS
jgi:DNA-binding winged helix-turn-helix (wHTH) protein/tetratricopeptide (TPR) repeat protein